MPSVGPAARRGAAAAAPLAPGSAAMSGAGAAAELARACACSGGGGEGAGAAVGFEGGVGRRGMDGVLVPSGRLSH